MFNKISTTKHDHLWLAKSINTAALSFLLAPLTIVLMDMVFLNISSQQGAEESFALLLLMPKLGLAFPLLCSCIAALISWTRIKLTTSKITLIQASLIVDLIVIIPLLPLIFSLFSGPAIRASFLKTPLLLVSVAFTYLGVHFLRKATDKVSSWIRTTTTASKRSTIGISAALIITMISLGRVVNTHILPGLYLSFHQLVVIATLILVAASYYVILSAYPPKIRGKRWVVLLATILIVSWAGGSIAAKSAVLGRLIITEHAPMIGAFLGPVLTCERTILSSFSNKKTIKKSNQRPFGSIEFQEGSNKKSIVLISVDALRSDVLEPKGRFKNAAAKLINQKKRSLFFERAYAPANYTPYAIPAMTLGFVPQANAYLQEDHCISAPFNRAGYRTELYFTAHEYASLEQTDLWPLASQGFFFDHYRPHYETAKQVLERVNKTLQKVGRPVFIWAHLSDVHYPFLLRTKNFAPTYEGQLRYLDSIIGPFIERLSQMRPDVIWALTSDHGEALGEHGTRYHGSTLYDEQTRIPLMIGGGNIKAGHISGPVGTVTLGATLLSLAGATVPPAVPILPLSQQEETSRPILLVGKGGQCGVVTGDMKFIADTKMGTAALFNLQTDPLEKINLIAKQPALARDLKQLTTKLGCIFDLTIVDI